MTQKTSDRISIPLTDGALAILEKYKGQETEDGHIFDVPTNQKLNDNVKDAAREAGLDRLIIDTYFIGTKRFNTNSMKLFHVMMPAELLFHALWQWVYQHRL